MLYNIHNCNDFVSIALLQNYNVLNMVHLTVCTSMEQPVFWQYFCHFLSQLKTNYILVIKYDIMVNCTSYIEQSLYVSEMCDL